MADSYKRPRFVREESWRYKRVKSAWRAPHGKTSRMRRSKEGWPPVVKIGYSKPNATRGLHPSGLRDVLVRRPEDLDRIDEKIQIARIAHTVGENKRVLIVNEAKKLNIRILNPRLKRAETPVPETTTTEEGKESEAETAPEAAKAAPELESTDAGEKTEQKSTEPEGKNSK